MTLATPVFQIDWLDPELWKFFLALLSLILSFVTPILANQVRFYFKALRQRVEAEIGAKNYEYLRQFVEAMIHAAEQIAGLETNEAKKTFVLDAVMTFVEQNNIPLSRDQVDALIEGIFNDIKPFLNQQVSWSVESSVTK